MVQCFRISSVYSQSQGDRLMVTIVTGNSNPIPPPFLFDKLPDDLSPQNHHVLRALPCHENRKLLHVPPTIRKEYPRRHSGGCHRSGIPPHAESQIHIRRATPIPRLRGRSHGTQRHRAGNGTTCTSSLTSNTRRSSEGHIIHPPPTRTGPEIDLNHRPHRPSTR